MFTSGSLVSRSRLGVPCECLFREIRVTLVTGNPHSVCQTVRSSPQSRCSSNVNGNTTVNEGKDGRSERQPSASRRDSNKIFNSEFFYTNSQFWTPSISSKGLLAQTHLMTTATPEHQRRLRQLSFREVVVDLVRVAMTGCYKDRRSLFARINSRIFCYLLVRR